MYLAEKKGANETVQERESTGSPPWPEILCEPEPDMEMS